MLLVCKGWLRVGTPLLYRTVVLRSLPQAQALADSLQANKALGRHIRKLRVEGGYAMAMHKILTSAPNISDLYLSLFIWSDDSVSGLCRSLSSINPSRVILHDHISEAKFNAKSRQLAEKLCECIPQWTNLVNFHFPYHCDSDPSFSVRKRSGTIAEALRKAPNLEIVSAPPTYWVPKDYITISRNPSLRTIRIKGLYGEVGEPFRQCLTLDSNAKLRDLMTFDEAPVKKPEPIQQQVHTPRICILPLQQAPHEIQDQIWSKVLDFALNTTPDLRLMDGHQLDVYRKSAANAWRVTLLLVSKTFHRLALPHFYDHPIIFSRKALYRFSERLVDDPSLGLHLRSFFVWRPEYDDGDDDHVTDAEADNKALTDIISRAPRLLRVYGMDQDDMQPYLFWLHGSLLSWEMFCLLEATAGPSLLEFESISIYDAPKVCTPCRLHSFTRLRSLNWNCHAIFDANDESLTECLPLLESLCISVGDTSFFQLVSHMTLPALSRLVCDSSADDVKTFLLKHGPKLRELKLGDCHGLPIVEMCPSLKVLSFVFDPKSDESVVFCCNFQHESLQKVVISRRRMCGLDKPDYDKFFANLNLTHFPALREMRVEGCEWPTDMRKVSKSTWVAHSETLLKSGVTLTDKVGQPWRHRLKRSK